LPGNVLTYDYDHDTLDPLCKDKQARKRGLTVVAKIIDAGDQLSSESRKECVL
jgi:hypothetical protein